LLAVPVGWWLAQPGKEGPAATPRIAVEEAVFESPVNARRDVRLPDGSRLTLDRDSRVAIAFSRDVRGLRLERGRAFFAVQKNKARPFVVNAGSLTATAVGTAFAVGMTGAERKVTTTEGLVRVDTRAALADGSHRAMVGAGMSLRQSGSQVTLAPIEAEQATAWREGRIVFSRRCLGSVVAEMNRYGALHLALEPGAARIAVSGVFDLDRTQSLTDALEAQGLVRVSARTADTRTLARGASADDTACQP
ncbi:FecR domain-containing protein, partial [Novosphingobium sp. 1949]